MRILRLLWWLFGLVCLIASVTLGFIAVAGYAFNPSGRIIAHVIAILALLLTILGIRSLYLGVLTRP